MCCKTIDCVHERQRLDKPMEVDSEILKKANDMMAENANSGGRIFNLLWLDFRESIDS